jgi:N-acetylmuramoyl-L-alanine amidase
MITINIHGNNFLSKLLFAHIIGLFISISGNTQAQVPIYIKTAGKLPQLAWSSGSDRLGSAKMGYIDTGIVMEVADTLGSLYKVKLSQHRHAFIEKALTTPGEIATRQPVVTAESWRVKGGEAEAEDSLTINLARKLPYQSWMETYPTRIVLELYGVQSNTNWITQLQSAREVESVDFRQTEDDVMQVFIYLKHKQPMGYRIMYRGNQLLMTIKVPQTDKKLKGKTIVVDAGHGGTNTGAKGVNTGILEKDYTLLFAKALEKELVQQGATVVMVRNKDTLIDNKDRVLWAIEQNPDLFISIHLNSAGRPSARGTSTYYKHVAFSPLSKAILGRLLKIDGLEEFGHIGSFNFQPVQPTEFPSCLVEIAFLSNPEDEQMIRDANFRSKVAKQIRLGIEDWCAGVKEVQF